jgi:hypothetical protein
MVDTSVLPSPAGGPAGRWMILAHRRTLQPDAADFEREPELRV